MRCKLLYTYSDAEKELVFERVIDLATGDSDLQPRAKRTLGNWRKKWRQGGDSRGFNQLHWMTNIMIHNALHWLLSEETVTFEELVNVNQKPEMTFMLWTGDTPEEVNRLNRVAAEDVGIDPDDVDIRRNYLIEALVFAST